MKVLVTGGCGFIGSHFIRVIFEHRPDWEVVNLDALTYAGNLASTLDIQTHPKYRFVYGSIADKSLVERLVADVDMVVNFAAETHVDRSIVDNEPFILTNILGVQRLIDACVRHGKRFHHVSTDEVFGHLGPDDPKFDESTPYAPRNPYSATKAASDHLVRAAVHTHGLRGTISNCTNNYGPNQHPEKLIPKMIYNIFNNFPLPIYGNGKNLREWIYVKDHCEALFEIFKKGKIGEFYNIGSGQDLNNKSIVKYLLEISKKNILIGKKVKIKYVKDRPGHDVRYALNSNKIKKKINWVANTKVKKGLENTFQWYLDNKKYFNLINKKDILKRLGKK